MFSHWTFGVIVISLLAGASLPLAFAPVSIWPLALVSLAVALYLLIRSASNTSALLIGYSFGLGYFTVGVSWVYFSLHDYGHASVFVAAAMTALLIVYLSGFIGLLFWLIRKLNFHQSKHLIWVVPMLWFAMEWLKGWLLTGFPWLSLGYAFIDSPLAGFVPIVGVYGVSALAVLISASLVMFWVQRVWQILLIPSGVLVVGFLLGFIHWSQPVGQPIEVVMVQANIDQAIKWRRSERLNIVRRYQAMSDSHWDADLIVWPEAAIPGRSEDVRKQILDPLSQRAAESGATLFTGIIVSDWKKRIYYNSMIMLGDNPGQYHKRHLVPFGEYMPFRSLLQFLRQYIDIPMSDMSPGPDQQALLEVKGQTLGVSICYEDVFSRDILRDLPDATLLVNTSNDTWFGDSLAPHQHLEIARMRALETARPMVRATNTGRSAIIDVKGRVEQDTDLFVAQTIRASVRGFTGTTPFIIFAPWQAFITVFIIAWVVWQFYRLRQKRTTPPLSQ